MPKFPITRIVVYLALSLLTPHVFAEEFTLDVDADGKTEPLTDGLLIIRHLFDFEGDTLTSSAVGGDATRSNPQEIKDHLNTYSTKLDIDDDGTVQPLTDGLLIIRSLFDFSDDALISNAIASTGSRNTANAIETYLQSIKDTDADGVVDSLDAFATDPTETLDTDSDGVGNNTDTDDDGDGVFDADDVFPNNGSEAVDSDGDGVGDNADVFPNDGSETLDSDGDGVGNNADAFPNDGSETVDSDGDGVGDNADHFPSIASTANSSVRASILYDPPPKDDRAKYLIQIGKNRPKTSMTNTYIKGSDVPQSTQDSIETILQAIGEMLGYYDVNYFLYGGTYEGSEHVALAYCDLWKDKYDIKENRGCSRFTDKLREILGTGDANSASPGFGRDAEYWANESVWINPPNTIAHYVEYYDATEPSHTRVVIHEYVSIHQSRPQLNATYFDESTGRPIPDWFMQGMQEFFGISANREINPFNHHQGNLWNALEQVRNNKYGLQDITTRLEVWARQRDAGDYRDTELGALAVAHMVSLTDWQTVMITLINEIYEKGWDQAFEDNIGMSMTDFYSEFEDHMAQDDATIIASVPASTDLKSELTPTSPIPRIQITGATNELNSGGEASDQKRTVYVYAPDGDASHSYSGIDWPYVTTSDSSILIDSDVTANFTIDRSGRILIDGMPLYQYQMDTTELQAKGDYNNDVWYSVLPNGSSSENLSFRPRLKN